MRISSYQHLRAQISQNGNQTIGSHTLEHQVLLSVPSGRSGEAIEGTRCLCTKSADPIFSVRICVERELAAFASCAGLRRLMWLSKAIGAAVELRVYITCYTKCCFNRATHFRNRNKPLMTPFQKWVHDYFA